MKPRYEYVPQREWKPVKQNLARLLRKLADLVYRELDVRIRFQFVGSSNRSGSCFITRVRGGNRGFDFDVNVIVERPSNQKVWRAAWIRAQLFKYCEIVFKDAGYQSLEDRTSVIRVKFLDESNRTIIHSCDFAVFQDLGDGEGLKYCRKYDNGGYGWVLRGGGNWTTEEKLSWLKQYDPGWHVRLREEYLKLKNVNQDESKASFQLFNEAVANVYNRVCQQLDE